jgi:hypothetical protein
MHAITLKQISEVFHNSILDFRFWILDWSAALALPPDFEKLDFHRSLNPKSKIQNKKSRAKQRGTSRKPEVAGPRFLRAELFSGLFYVAASRLNSPRFSNGAYTPLPSFCQVLISLMAGHLHRCTAIGFNIPVSVC